MQSVRAIQNNATGGAGIGSDQAIFRLLNQELTFTNLVATVTDPRITANDAVLVYYADASIATAAGIQVSWTDGTVTFTASQAPSGTVVVNIYDIKPALANTWDSIGADEVSYDNTDSGLTAVTVQDAIDEVAQGGGGVSIYNDNHRYTCSSANTWIDYGSYSTVAGGIYLLSWSTSTTSTHSISIRFYNATATYVQRSSYGDAGFMILFQANSSSVQLQMRSTNTENNVMAYMSLARLG